MVSRKVEITQKVMSLIEFPMTYNLELTVILHPETPELDSLRGEERVGLTERVVLA